MDKTGFLKELKQHLAVLNEDEQKDILDEYIQHIDMKMAAGMSESEAIRDFGEIGELAAEILEAYHVNPQYSAKKRGKMVHMDEIPVGEIAGKGRDLWSKIREAAKSLGRSVAAGAAAVLRLIRRPFLWAREKRDRRGQARIKDVRRVEEHMTQQDGIIRRSLRTAGRWGQSVIVGVLCAAAWCIRWSWNICMILAALFTGGFTLLWLFGFGMLLVLLIQGYPLWGFTIGCLGLVLSTGSLTALALILIRIKHRKAGEERKAAEIPEEVPEHA